MYKLQDEKSAMQKSAVLQSPNIIFLYLYLFFTYTYSLPILILYLYLFFAYTYSLPILILCSAYSVFIQFLLSSIQARPRSTTPSAPPSYTTILLYFNTSRVKKILFQFIYFFKCLKNKFFLIYWSQLEIRLEIIFH